MEGIRWFARETQLINNKILAQSKRNLRLQGMGTTMVAAITFKDAVVVANIGDSRGYIPSSKPINADYSRPFIG